MAELLILICAGLCLLLAGALNLDRRNTERCKMKTIAKVVESKKIDDGVYTYGFDRYSTIFEFEANDITYRGKGNSVTSCTSKYEEDESVYVKYNENDPKEFYVMGTETTRSSIIGLCFVAVILIIFAICSLIF